VATKESLKFIPIAEIRENPIALRAVNKQDEGFTGLVESIKKEGIITPISVREIKDPETGQKYYSLIDGLHRYNAAIEAGLDQMPCYVKDADDAKVLELQLMANIHKVETRPVEYSKQLVRIFGNNPLMTQAELSVKLGTSPTWIAQRLGLVKLTKSVADLVDDSTIPLSNAYVLAKLPPEEQANFVERAMTMGAAQFTPNVNARIKELRDAKRQGRDAAPVEFQPVPHVRKLGELKSELDQPESLLTLVREQNLKSPAEIVKATLAWVLSLDAVSVQIARDKDAARERESNDAKLARKAEREAKKAAAAAETQKAAQEMTA
jgi:ParB family chromosome partitioning protein